MDSKLNAIDHLLSFYVDNLRLGDMASINTAIFLLGMWI